jgi:hypothetical protein
MLRMKRILPRGLIGLVILINLQCAIVFILSPGAYAPAFELRGAIGKAMLRGMGILFLMWNVPYLVALWDPEKHRLALYEALVMQTIGLVGEVALYATLPVVHTPARNSIQRFIVFDALGLLALIAAAWLSHPPKVHPQRGD